MDPLIGIELDGRYRLVSELGEGAMGKVYRAERIAAGETGFAAVKVLNEDCSAQPDLRERFEREARALFGLAHPHILEVQDFGMTPLHRPYLVMELLEGQSLDEMVDGEILPPDQALQLGRQLLEGLAFAHDQGVVHRDLKTENVFVVRNSTGGYHAKLLDFGLVKFTDDERWGEGRKLTVAGSVMGSPAYMSPEQATGAPIDARSDVYSVGIVIYELVTGHWPFECESRSDMLRAHLIEPPPTIAAGRDGLECRPELEALVQKAMAKSANDRHANAREMLAALTAIPAPAAWLNVQAGQKAPLAGGALPAFQDLVDAPLPGVLPVATAMPAAPARAISESPAVAVLPAGGSAQPAPQSLPALPIKASQTAIIVLAVVVGLCAASAVIGAAIALFAS